MIKISEKIWFVKGVDREDGLAYMCPYQESKEGEPLANVAKMQDTGRSWASTSPQTVWKRNEDGSMVYDENKRPVVDYVKPARNGEEGFADNVPTKGFYVGCSVSRWSTSNKLFRVKDPRGFTVEIPTDNLATLLHHTTVVNGVVQEECVWGREGNNHILLPVNSEPYLVTLNQMDTLENKLILIKDLKAGDWVKFFEDDNDYYYMGKVKVTWSVTPYNYDNSYRWGHGSRERKQTYGETVVVKDDKWVDVFLYKNKWSSDKSKWGVEHPSKPKVVKVLKHEKVDIDKDGISMYLPDRVRNKVYARGDWYYHEAKIVEIEVK